MQTKIDQTPLVHDLISTMSDAEYSNEAIDVLSFNWYIIITGATIPDDAPTITFKGSTWIGIIEDTENEDKRHPETD